MTISSPCIKRCVIDGDPGLCLGCGRTLDEIGRWGALAEVDRLAIMARLPARLVHAASASSADPSRSAASTARQGRSSSCST